MANNETVKRSGDTITVSAFWAKIIASLVVLACGGIGSVLLSVHDATIRFDEQQRNQDNRITWLERFGPESGDRFTKRDGEHISSRIDGHTRDIAKLNEWVIRHEAWGKRKTGEWDVLHESHTRRLDRIEQR